MATVQSKRQSDLEKRLQILRRQVYGRSSEELRKTQINQKAGQSENQTLRYTDIPILPDTPSHSDQAQLGSESFRSDLAYLRQDLLKILILASFAIGAQIIFFIFSKNHILNLNFF